MRTISGKTKAWFAGSTYGPEDLNGMSDEVLGRVVAYSSNLNMAEHGWSLIGDAEITLHVEDEDTLIANKVQGLRGELARVRAESQAKETRIEEQIQKLLAITYTPEPA